MAGSISDIVATGQNAVVAVNGLQNQLTTISSAIMAVTDIATTVSSMETTLNSMDTKLTSMDATLTGAATTLSSLSSAVDQVVTSVSSISFQMTGMAVSLSSMSATLASIEALMAKPTGAFRVDRNGVDQGGLAAGAYNKILFTRAVYDPAGFFDTAVNHRYQPNAAGAYFFSLTARSSYALTGDATHAAIYLNGSANALGTYVASTVADTSWSIANALISLNGTTDYVEGYAYVPATATGINGTPTDTFMIGHRIA